MKVFKAILKFNKDNELYDVIDLESFDLIEAQHIFIEERNKKRIPWRKTNFPYDIEFVDGKRYKFVMGNRVEQLAGRKCTKEFLPKYLELY